MLLATQFSGHVKTEPVMRQYSCAHISWEFAPTLSYPKVFGVGDAETIFTDGDDVITNKMDDVSMASVTTNDNALPLSLNSHPLRWMGEASTENSDWPEDSTPFNRLPNLLPPSAFSLIPPFKYVQLYLKYSAIRVFTFNRYIFSETILTRK